jgi:cobalt-zinc-cadmium efflux system outer membrane protein
LSAHPAVALAQVDVQAKNARVDLARAERIPDVKVEALYHRLESSRENTVDLGLSIPLPLFQRNEGRLREARADARAAEARAKATQNELNLRLREAYTQLTAALETSRTLRNEILPRADRVRRTAEARYEAGDLSLAEVLPVRRDWTSLQMDYLESLRAALQAWAELSPYLKSP